MAGQDTIDIEDFANQVKKDLVSFFTNLVWANLIIVAPWLTSPILAIPVKYVIELIIEFLATTGGLAAFVINTKVFTTDQAKDYMEAVSNLLTLPDSVSDEEWEKAEDETNKAFANLVNFTK